MFVGRTHSPSAETSGDRVHCAVIERAEESNILPMQTVIKY